MVGFASGKLALGICGRCNRKFPYQKLRADGNSPSLRVCDEDWDCRNPWRDPPIQPDPISLKYPRPDTYIGTSGSQSYPDITDPFHPVPPNEGDYPTK